MKRDRARTKILRTSPFGLIEMTRQRIRPSLKRSVYRDCPGCSGTGVVKTAESMAIEVMRLLILATQQQIAGYEQTNTDADSTTLSMLQTQLQASYQITSEISQLSLVHYMPAGL